MENKLHDAIANICSFIKANHNIDYVGSYVKQDNPLLYIITFEGNNQRKIVAELLENGSICVLQTIDVVYNDLLGFMNKFMEFLGADDDSD